MARIRTDLAERENSSTPARRIGRDARTAREGRRRGGDQEAGRTTRRTRATSLVTSNPLGATTAAGRCSERMATPASFFSGCQMKSALDEFSRRTTKLADHDAPPSRRAARRRPLPPRRRPPRRVASRRRRRACPRSRRTRRPRRGDGRARPSRCRSARSSARRSSASSDSTFARARARRADARRRRRTRRRRRRPPPRSPRSRSDPTTPGMATRSATRRVRGGGGGGGGEGGQETRSSQLSRSRPLPRANALFSTLLCVVALASPAILPLGLLGRILLALGAFQHACKVIEARRGYAPRGVVHAGTLRGYFASPIEPLAAQWSERAGTGDGVSNGNGRGR